MTTEAARSPCIRNCSLDAQRICRGCFRALDEIVAWSDADEATRHDILERAAARRELETSAAALSSPA